MEYISINNLTDTIKKNLDKIPTDIDLIVANPRSGLLPASIIALLKNLPLCDINSLVKDNIFEFGETKNTDFITSVEQANHILIVDDSSYSGNAIKKMRLKIPPDLLKKCCFLTIFVNDKTKDLSDIYFEIINKSRLFEWNLFHHTYLQYSGVDLKVIYNGSLFKIVPTRKIGAIIIEDNMNKDEISNILNKTEIKYDKILYKNEIDQNVKFIITNAYKDFAFINDEVDIIDYQNSKIYHRLKF